MKPMKPRNWKQIAWIVTALAVLTVIFAPASSASGQQLVVEMTEPFEINGVLYPADVVRVQELGAYNPTSTLNEVWVGNECLGVLLAKTGDNETQAATHSLTFAQDRNGHLVLLGIAYRGEPARDLYGFRVDSRGGHWSSAESTLLASLAD